MRLSALKLTTFASITFVVAMAVSVVPQTKGIPSIGVAEAQARIGRPATPASVAGVARRTTRQTVRRHAVAGGAVAPVVRCGYYPYPPCH